MEKDVPFLIDQLFQKYSAIGRISDWRSLQAARDLDQINAIIDQRALLISEIQEIASEIKIANHGEFPAHNPKVGEIKCILAEIQISDSVIMSKIAQRMEEIKETLKTQSIFRMHALPSYIKQKYAFSR